MTEEERIIIQMVADIIGVEEDTITPEMTMNEIGADELHMVEITMALEQAIDVVFPDGRLLINPEKDADFTLNDVLQIAAEYY